ncbi:hypothetical protein P7H15_14870 [Paenibacillus larvae]|nr:binary toxin-like calcium binding domain-containing protein [Paenibacillus larvae]MDT2293849.1 hypothetical protein [Paenibacillus larvae]
MTEQEELLQLDALYLQSTRKQKRLRLKPFLFLKSFLLESLPMGTDSRTEENKQPMLDTDDDGICDEWEVNGYYVKNNIAVFPWPKKGSKEEEEFGPII